MRLRPPQSRLHLQCFSWLLRSCSQAEVDLHPATLKVQINHVLSFKIPKWFCQSVSFGSLCKEDHIYCVALLFVLWFFPKEVYRNIKIIRRWRHLATFLFFFSHLAKWGVSNSGVTISGGSNGSLLISHNTSLFWTYVALSLHCLRLLPLSIKTQYIFVLCR